MNQVVPTIDHRSKLQMIMELGYNIVMTTSDNTDSGFITAIAIFRETGKLIKYTPDTTYDAEYSNGYVIRTINKKREIEGISSLFHRAMNNFVQTIKAN